MVSVLGHNPKVPGSKQAPLCCSLDWFIVLTFLDVVQIILRDYRYACQSDDQVPLAQWLERWSYEP